MNEELEKMIKAYKEARDNRCLIENIYPEFFFKFGDMLLNHIENSIPKEKVEEKMIIDIDKLNHSTNGILSEMYKARITLAKELLEEK